MVFTTKELQHERNNKHHPFCIIHIFSFRYGTSKLILRRICFRG